MAFRFSCDVHLLHVAFVTTTSQARHDLDMQSVKSMIREICSHRRASLPKDLRVQSVSQRKDQQITYLGWVRVGIRSGEVTPNSPSRPHSSMSQQSASSVGSSNVNLRIRTAASRRPRPASIAGTGVSVTEKHSEHAHFTSPPMDPLLDRRGSARGPGKKEKKKTIRQNCILD